MREPCVHFTIRKLVFHSLTAFLVVPRAFVHRGQLNASSCRFWESFVASEIM